MTERNTLVFDTNGQGLEVFKDRIWVPRMGGIRGLLMEEAHKTMYSIHPGNTKMYRDLKTLLLVADDEARSC